MSVCLLLVPHAGQFLFNSHASSISIARRRLPSSPAIGPKASIGHRPSRFRYQPALICPSSFPHFFFCHLSSLPWTELFSPPLRVHHHYSMRYALHPQSHLSPVLVIDVFRSSLGPDPSGRSRVSSRSFSTSIRTKMNDYH
ncbi:hypothetical protein FA10DRAFT_121275 [Acaromyces ingoldii]|uniref:Uncharacterized protein n=1 Tax=Acaromyces ingoldii TaxID=215250 RepID=A0A316YRP9_9BASI|nr:hypothetical protein FA10DRAFT_121275 [Acaromyces ingoldii]PWN90683.1 hypothetical protein FA10DRAFT_121275 [Acaromyces ingoldii]